jgi:hypothetical protein
MRRMKEWYGCSPRHPESCQRGHDEIAAELASTLCEAIFTRAVLESQRVRFNSRSIELAGEVNQSMPERVVHSLSRALNVL